MWTGYQQQKKEKKRNHHTNTHKEKQDGVKVKVEGKKNYLQKKNLSWLQKEPAPLKK